MTNSARFAMFAAALLAAGRLAAVEPPPAVLPGTAPLESHEDLSVRLVEQAHRLLDQKTAASPAGRRAFWRRDLSSPERYARSVIPNRERLKRILGVVDSRLPPAMERYGDDNLAPLVAETESYRICQVRWRVLPGVTGEGLLAEPKLPSLAHVVALPDADQTPEQLLGLSPGIPVGSQFRGSWRRTGFACSCPCSSAAATISRAIRW